MRSCRRHTLVLVAFISGVVALGCAASKKDDADATPPGGAGGSGSAGQSGAGGTGTSGAGGQQATGGHAADAGQPGVGGMSGVGGKSGQGGSAPDAAADTNPGTGGRADAGDAGRDASNADGAAAFSPCPTDGGACVILPLGDSITDGFPFEMGGYRVELFNQTVAASKHVTFVGSLSNGPPNTPAFPPKHEGHTGFTIINETSVGRSGISPAITDTAISTYHPNIILLMIGTNDVNLSVDLGNAPGRLATLIYEIITDAPSSLLVGAQLTPTTTDAENMRFQTYNAAIPGIVQQRAAAGKHVLLVDMYSTFTANANYKTALMNDNLHPNPTGYALMGDTWYKTIASFLH